jgi:hypothetical protein
LRIEPLAPIDPDYQRGLDALMQNQVREAASSFEASYARTQDPRTLLQLGAAHTQLGQPQAALKALQSYVDHPSPERDQASIDSAKQAIAELRTGNGHIGLHLVPTHAKVTVDGQEVDVSGGELLVTPGKHVLAARADGYQPYSQSLDVPAGQFTLEIQLERIDTSSLAAAKLATPAPQPPAPADDATDEPEASEGGRCLLSQVCLGPVVSLLGPPNLIGGGVHARIGRYFGVGFDYQALPKMTFSPISIGTSLVSANARVYPFGGAFFVSGGFGYQSIRGDIQQGDIAIHASTGFPAAVASLGFMGHDGFVLGADLGLLFPLSPMRLKLTDNAAALAQNGISQDDIDEARTKAQDRANKVLDAVPLLVQVNLIRLGYMF